MKKTAKKKKKKKRKEKKEREREKNFIANHAGVLATILSLWANCLSK